MARVAHNIVESWRQTDDQLEAAAAAHSDAVLILDELNQLDPKIAAECVYRFANEQGEVH